MTQACSPGAIISVSRPSLPTADKLVPWLQHMDAAQIYANNGPLCRLFADGLAQLYGTPDGAMPVVSGTAGLTVALLAQGVVPGGLCMVPSWTFVATGHAARGAGLVPWLVDVDEDSGMLTPAMAEAFLLEAPGPVAAVMPVAPFGAPFPYEAWEAFHQRTGIPVVIDAAAAFDTVRPCSVPAVVSLHATKLFGVGEGGFVTCTQPELMRKIECAGNFGFYGSRIATVPACNGKMSELHAAVGLAGLAEWQARRQSLATLCGSLATALAGVPHVRLQPGWGRDWISATCVVRLSVCIATVEDVLAQSGIETRRWWGDGLHAQPAFAQCPHTALTVGERLAGSTLGLPCHLNLTPMEIDRIATALHQGVQAAY